MRSPKNKRRVVLSAFIYFLLLSLGIPGKLRLNRDNFHFGGAELAIVPFYLPLLAWLVTFVLVGWNSRLKLDTPVMVLLMFLGIQALLVPFATLPFWAILEFGRLCLCGIVFMLFAEGLRDNAGIRALGAGIISLVLLQAAASLLQASTGVTLSGLDFQQTELNVVSESSFRLVGTFGHPGAMAQFLTIVFPPLAYCLGRMRRKAIGRAALIAVPVLVVFSQSRTGIVVMAAALMVLIAAYSRSIKSATKKWLFLIGTAVLMTAAVVELWEPITTRFVQDPGESTNARILIAETALKMIAAHPIFGVGLNNFTEVMRGYDVGGITVDFLYPVHNVYLLIAAETGLFGFASFILMNAYFVALAFKNMRRAPGGAYGSLSFYILISLGAIYATAMLGWAWRQDSIQCIYWVALGAIAAERRGLGKPEGAARCY